MPPGIKPIKAKPSETGIPPTTTVPYNSPRPGVGITPVTPEVPNAVTPEVPRTVYPSSPLNPPVPYNSPRPGVTVGGTVLGPQVPDWSKIPGAKQTTGMSPDVLEAQRDVRIQQAAATRAGVSDSEIQQITEQKKPNKGLQAIGKVLNFDIIPGSKEFKPILKTIEGPLTELDTGRRAILSTLKETGDLLGQARKAAGDTPLIGTGKFLGIPGTEQDKNYTNSFSFNDWKKQTDDLTIGTGQLLGDITPYKWVNRALGLYGDIFFDPVTWVSGPGGLIKGSTIKAVEEGGVAATKLANIAAREAAGEVVSAAEKAAVKVAQESTLGAVEFTQRTGARRVLGARTREELAQAAREVRLAAEKSGNLAVANTLTDDVITEIGVRGYSAMRGPVGQALGVRGGLRFGAGNAKVIIPFTEKLTNAFGSGLTAIRLGSDSINAPRALSIINKGFIGTRAGQAILRNATPFGEGGLYGTDDLLRMRTALRSGKVVDSETGRLIKLSGQQGNDFVKLLAQDKAYRLLKGQANAEAQALLKSIMSDKKFFQHSNSISELLENPKLNLLDEALDAPTATGIVGRVISPEELAYAVQLRKIGNEFYERANFLNLRAKAAAGMPIDIIEDLPKNKAWFPHVLSADATEAINAKKIGDNVLRELGYDRSYALAGSNIRDLVAGERFFGYKLLQTDIDGGIKRLNEIARQYGKIKFDFFEPNAEYAYIQYAKGFAKDSSFTEFLHNMQLATSAEELRLSGVGLPPGARSTGLFNEKAFAGDLTQTRTARISAAKPSTLPGFESAIVDVISPQRINVIESIPALKANLEGIIDDMVELSTKKLEKGGVQWAPQINQTISDLEMRIRDLERLAEVPFGYSAAISSEANALGLSFVNEAKRLVLNVDAVDPKNWQRILPIYLDAFDSFMQVNAQKYPGLVASPQMKELLTNMQRLEDPAFAAIAQKLLGKQTQMFKSWVTASPGFHIRNAMSNTFFMLSAGANPANIAEGTQVYRGWNKFLKKLTLDKTIDTEARAAASYYLISDLTKAEYESLSLKEINYLTRQNAYGGASKSATGEVVQLPALAREYVFDNIYIQDVLGFKDETYDMLYQAELGAWGGPPKEAARLKEHYAIWQRESKKVADALSSTSTAGFGQAGEIFEGGARAGVTGGQNLGTNTAANISRTLAKPLAWSKKGGNIVENWSRFALTYDGLKQGLGNEGAAARTAKYLIDYQDLSILDKNIKQVIPFWTWSSRSFPLIVESMWLNPKAYKIYDNIKRNLTDEDTEGQVIPGYAAAAGAFKLPFGNNLYAQPDLGFTKQEEGFGKLTDPMSILASISPLVRAPIEAAVNLKFGTGKNIFNKNYDEGTLKQLQYLAQQLTPQAGALGKYVNAGIGAVSQFGPPGQAVAGALQNIPSPIQDTLGIGKANYLEQKPETEGGGKMSPEEARQKLISFFGLPGFELQDYQQVAALKAILAQLQETTNRAKNKQKAERNK